MDEEMDLVTVFRTAGTTSEMEALNVQALLESDGIATVFVGDARYPNFPDEIRVAKKDAGRAQALIVEAQAAGPKAAEEAEAATEGNTPGEIR